MQKLGSLEELVCVISFINVSNLVVYHFIDTPLLVEPLEVAAVDLPLFMVFTVLNIENSSAPDFFDFVDIFLAVGVRAKHNAAILNFFEGKLPHVVTISLVQLPVYDKYFVCVVPVVLLSLRTMRALVLGGILDVEGSLRESLENNLIGFIVLPSVEVYEIRKGRVML